MGELFYLIADWPAPHHIGAVTTTRHEGESQLPYAGNNIALHVGDNSMHVQCNRQALQQRLRLPATPVWLEQTHSTRCVVVEDEATRNADAAVTRNKNYPLAIMTADCLPVILCNREGTEIAAVHCGWRGLVGGILENTLGKMHSRAEDILAWLGPAICCQCFEVGREVLEVYADRYPYTQNTFVQKGEKWLANLAKMAELILNAQGVKAVYSSNACTFELERHFYSYRRQTQTGRMATLIWFKQDT
ncbi:peptidoglycan editing factor PgeF [Legionella septentrionalis]|uniref:peptidoglycan editing factor PgeF n=1 Tax=Legionella septentrionalis TaxID=2498109 RepID=UPI0039891E34